VNWTYLPSPIPQKSWGETYNNARVRDYNARIRSEFAKAVEWNIIKLKDVDQTTSSRYAVVFTEPLHLADILGGFDMQLHASKPNLGEVQRVGAELRRMLDEGLVQEATKDIFGSIHEDMAKENFIRSPQLITRVREEIGKYETIQAKVIELEKVLTQFQGEEKLQDQFIEAFYTGTICKRGALYVYDRDAEEEAWEPFANLMKSRDFVEFEIFEQFRQLDEKNRSMLMRKASRRSSEMTASEDIAPLLSKLEELYEVFLDARDRLEYEKIELANGEEAYQFYKQMTTKLHAIRRKLKS